MSTDSPSHSRWRTLFGSISFPVEGRRVGRVIGLLVMSIGVLTLLFGCAVVDAGSVGVERYEEPSGKFIRGVSPADESRYVRLLDFVSLGHWMQRGGCGLAGCGLILFARPRLVRRLLGSPKPREIPPQDPREATPGSRETETLQEEVT